MKDIIFIEDLVVKHVPNQHLFSVLSDQLYMHYIDCNCDPDVLNWHIQQKYVPVTTFFGLNRKEHYRDTKYDPINDRIMIAYSEEVEELLGIPIRILIENEKKATEGYRRMSTELNQYKSMGFWKRLKFLFRGTKLFERKMFKGKIDFVKFYPYVLTKEQITIKYNKLKEKIRMSKLNYLSLLKSKLFWKAVHTYIKYLFIGMDQHKDWGKICRKAKIEAITVFTRPLVTAALKSMFIQSNNELSKMMVEYFSVFEEMKKFAIELREDKDLNDKI